MEKIRDVIVNITYPGNKIWIDQITPWFTDEENEYASQRLTHYHNLLRDLLLPARDTIRYCIMEYYKDRPSHSVKLYRILKESFAPVVTDEMTRLYETIMAIGWKIVVGNIRLCMHYTLKSLKKFPEQDVSTMFGDSLEGLHMGALSYDRVVGKEKGAKLITAAVYWIMSNIQKHCLNREAPEIHSSVWYDVKRCRAARFDWELNYPYKNFQWTDIQEDLNFSDSRFKLIMKHVDYVPLSLDLERSDSGSEMVSSLSDIVACPVDKERQEWVDLALDGYPIDEIRDGIPLWSNYSLIKQTLVDGEIYYRVKDVTRRCDYRGNDTEDKIEQVVINRKRRYEEKKIRNKQKELLRLEEEEVNRIIAVRKLKELTAKQLKQKEEEAKRSKTTSNGNKTRYAQTEEDIEKWGKRPPCGTREYDIWYRAKNKDRIKEQKDRHTFKVKKQRQEAHELMVAKKAAKKERKAQND